MLVSRKTASCAAAAAFIIFIWAPILESSPMPPFTIAISTPQESFKSGSKIELQIVATNTTDHDIVVEKSKGEGNAQEAGYIVEVTNAEGGSPPDTHLHRLLTGQDPYPPGDTRDALLATISSGESVKDKMMIDTMYDLSVPGKYLVYVQKTDPATKEVATSNTITITIAP